MADDQRDWIAALKDTDAGRNAAVGELRRRLLAGLRRALQRRDVSDAQLEDFTQEALIRIMRQLHQFKGRSRFTTWAQAIAINVAFAELRRKRWKDVSLDALTEESGQWDGLAMTRGAGAEDERDRILAALQRAIAESLTERQKAVILGRLHGLPSEQLVGMLGTSRGALYKLIHDARRTLQERLQAEGITARDIQNAFAP